MGEKRQGRGRKRWLALLAVLGWWMLWGGAVYGAEGGLTGQGEEDGGDIFGSGEEEAPGESVLGMGEEEALDRYLEELDFSEIDAVLGGGKGTVGMDFGELVQKIIQGEELDKGKLVMDVLSMLFDEIDSFRGIIVKIMFLCVAFAILYNFANVFENPAVTEISFYMVYLLLMVLLMNSFFVLRDVAIGVVE